MPILLSREAVGENARQILRCDAHTVVRNLEAHALAVRQTKAHCDGAWGTIPLLGCILGIPQKVPTRIFQHLCRSVSMVGTGSISFRYSKIRAGPYLPTSCPSILIKAGAGTFSRTPEVPGITLLHRDNFFDMTDMLHQSVQLFGSSSGAL